MELKELATRLVGFNTVSNRETEEIADFISNYLEGLGFKITQHKYFNGDVPKVNVIAQKGAGASRLALSGHMDTVPFDGSWKINSDPLVLTCFNGKYYARGISDMKLFLAMAMKAGEAVPVDSLKHPFSLCFTSDEEVGCIGVKDLVKKKGIHVADFVIIGEPTDLVPINAHKGYMYIAVELFGKRSHSSRPWEGISIIPALKTVLEKISLFENEMKKIKDDRFEPDFPTINLGVITTDEIKKQRNGQKVEVKVIKSIKNIIPGYCRLEIEIRPVPGQNPVDIFSVLRACIGEKVKDVEIKVAFVRAPTPPMETARDSLVVKIAEELSGKKSLAVPFNTEGGVFNSNSSHSVIWGPGSIEQAHKDDEFVLEKYFDPKIIDMYAQAIRKICC